MEERKEFKVGDFISKDAVRTREGSSHYHRMSDFCNDNRIAMKEGVITPEGENAVPFEAYIISEA